MAMSFAQSDIQTEETPVKISDKTWADRGFDFFIAGGMLFGSPFNANYYNGSKLNENNFEFILNNQYWYEEWQRTVSEYYPHISMSDRIYVKDPDDMDWNLRYKLSMMVSLGARYKLGNGWAVALSYSFSRLTTSTRVLLSSNAVTGNMYTQPVVAMVGKENRSMIDLSASYLFSRVSPVVKPFVELGVQFNYAKVKSFEATLLDKDGHAVGNSYSLRNVYKGCHFVGSEEFACHLLYVLCRNAVNPPEKRIKVALLTVVEVTPAEVEGKLFTVVTGNGNLSLQLSFGSCQP